MAVVIGDSHVQFFAALGIFVSALEIDTFPLYSCHLHFADCFDSVSVLQPHPVHVYPFEKSVFALVSFVAL